MYSVELANIPSDFYHVFNQAENAIIDVVKQSRKNPDDIYAIWYIGNYAGIEQERDLFALACNGGYLLIRSQNVNRSV